MTHFSASWRFSPGTMVGDDRAVPRGHHIQIDLRLALYLDDLFAMLRLHPALRRQVFALVVELLDVNVFDVRAEIGKSPRDVAIVSHDDERHARQRDAGDIEVSGREMGLIPDVGDAQVKVHVVRQQRLARRRVRAGDNPVVGAGTRGDRPAASLQACRDPSLIACHPERGRQSESKDPYSSSELLRRAFR